MEELKVLIETIGQGENVRSSWFDLPIDRAELEEVLGIDEGSGEYVITDMILPFSGEVREDTTVERLNELYHMYEALPSYVKAEYGDISDYFSDLEDMYIHQYDITYYEGCNSMADAAKIELGKNPSFSSLSERAVKYFNYEAYAKNLSEIYYFIKTDNGMYRIPR